MTEPLMITREMRDSRAEKVSKIIENINRDIKRASEKGLHECYFACSKDNYSSTVYKKSEKDWADYRIKPTGYIDGAWQRTEHIEW